MAYCLGCGQPLQVGAKFCSNCGAACSMVQPSPVVPVTAPAPITRVVLVEPRRAGRLAFKGFLLALVLGVIFVAAARDNKSAPPGGLAVAYGIGAAYIVYNLQKWKRSNEIVRGAAIAWTVAVLLGFGTFGGLVGMSTSGHSGGNSSAGDPKDILLRDVKLDFRWSKEGFGNVMVADFTVTNPTQFAFKDFKIKCTHYAPSGTEIDHNTRTIYEIVEPKSEKVIRQMNMGLIHSQAARSACEITDLAAVR